MSAAEQLEPFFVLRDGIRDDHAFVVDSWLTSHQHSSAGQEIRGVYFQRHKALVRTILNRQGTTLRVAHAPAEPDALLGWSCTGPRRVYYVYVKRDARRLGIARALLDGVSPPVVFCAKPVVRGISVPAGWTYDFYANFAEG